LVSNESLLLGFEKGESGKKPVSDTGKPSWQWAVWQRRGANSCFSIKYGVSLRSIRIVKFVKSSEGKTLIFGQIKNSEIRFQEKTPGSDAPRGIAAGKCCGLAEING